MPYKAAEDWRIRRLTETAENLCLNTETLDNAKEVAAKLLQTWKGPKAPLHILITQKEKQKTTRTNKAERGFQLTLLIEQWLF